MAVPIGGPFIFCKQRQIHLVRLPGEYSLTSNSSRVMNWIKDIYNLDFSHCGGMSSLIQSPIYIYPFCLWNQELLWDIRSLPYCGSPQEPSLCSPMALSTPFLLLVFLSPALLLQEQPGGRVLQWVGIFFPSWTNDFKETIIWQHDQNKPDGAHGSETWWASLKYS